MAIPFADMLEGLILVEEGHPDAALPVLESALKVFRSHRHMPLGDLPVEQTMLELALALAAMGDRGEALRLYEKVRPRLVALRSPLFDRCDQTIEVPHGG